MEARMRTAQDQVPDRFRDRAEAGRLLAGRLESYRQDPSVLILALPRGGVAVGYEISRALHLPLDVFITRKLGAPGNPEFAVGAVTETGSVYLNPGVVDNLAKFSNTDWLYAGAIQAQRDEITRRRALYRRARALPSLRERTVLLVDDGVATGATFLASVEALRSMQVGRLVAAVPVGPADTLGEIVKRVDKLVVLMMPEPFFAVGNHFLDFRQVEDEEVVRYLAEASAARV